MPAVNFDGKTLTIDGKRIWIVSGSLHFQRFPRETWPERIHAARLAGLNTIETPVFWNRVEPRQGSFDFKGDNDIRHFLTLVHEAGMHAILRPGPYVGTGWDFGGLPAWLLNNDALKLRAPSQPFLEATGRYFTALAKQVRDLQASSSGGGPIILIQNESHWTCDHEDAANAYLGELARYLREAGLNLPRINANNLWQGVEGEIDGWTGEGEMFAVLRQLSAVRPDQPRIVVDFGPIRRPRFGENAPDPIDPWTLQRQLGEILASAGQFNLSCFSSGTALGFWAGQSPRGEHTMLAPTQDLAACVDEHGRPTPVYPAVRRLASFASSFSRVFANHTAETPPIVIDPAPREGHIAGRTITHLRGSHGQVLFVFSPPKSKPGTLPLLMPDGSAMPVPLGNQQVHWCLLDTHLTGRAHLDYATLCTLFFSGTTLVVFGSAGSVGTVSINGTPVELEVPKGRRPVTIKVDEITIAVVSEELADETFHHAGTVYIGVAGLTTAFEPLPGSSKTHTEIAPDGAVSTVNTKAPADAPPARLPAVTIETWEAAPATAHIDGSSPRYAQINGPAELPALGAPQGYGWYRVNLRSGATRKIKAAAPEMADRAALFLDAEPVGLLGRGPGAEHQLPLSLKKGTHTLTILADNMGYPSGGSIMKYRKGLYGHLIEAAAFRTPKPKLVNAQPFNLLAWRTPLFRVREGDTTHPARVSWAFAHRKHTPLVIEIPPLPARALVLLNTEPVDFIDGMNARTLILSAEQLRRGNNELELALHTDEGDGPAAQARVEEVLAICSNIKFVEAASAATDKGDWAFAKWEAPGEHEYQEVAKSNLGKLTTPCWWRAFFNAPTERVALSLDLSGMNKGVVFLNGRNLGRYFSQTGAGKKVPPQLPMPLPRPYIKEKANELLIFDEHAGNPARIKIIVA